MHSAPSMPEQLALSEPPTSLLHFLIPIPMSPAASLALMAPITSTAFRPPHPAASLDPLATPSGIPTGTAPPFPEEEMQASSYSEFEGQVSLPHSFLYRYGAKTQDLRSGPLIRKLPYGALLLGDPDHGIPFLALLIMACRKGT